MIWPDGHACIKGPWLGWRQSVGEPLFPMGPSKILGGCDVRSQEFVPVQSCHISCQLAMSQSESAYSAIADWHWTTSNTTEVAIRAPYGDMGTSQRRNGDVRTWWHVGKIGPWPAMSGSATSKQARDGMVNLRPLSIHRRGRLQAAKQRSAPSVGRREQGPAGDVSGRQSPVDAETSCPHLISVSVPAARAAMSLR